MQNDKEYIDKAVEQFRTLLEQQIAREDRMKAGSQSVDFSKKDKIVIGVIPGDGIGPVIVEQARKVLENLLADEIASGKIILKDIEGLTIENRLACGESVPKNVLNEIKSCDVLLKGPTETPKGGTMESANVTLRRELDLFSNVRPVSLPEENIDWTFFREKTIGCKIKNTVLIHNATVRELAARCHGIEGSGVFLVGNSKNRYLNTGVFSIELVCNILNGFCFLRSSPIGIGDFYGVRSLG